MHYLTLTALVYVALWFLNMLFGNYTAILIQSFIGVFLFITLALEISGLEKDNVRNHVNLDLRINKLQKELEELVNEKS
jgi:hypothetical protein